GSPEAGAGQGGQRNRGGAAVRDDRAARQRRDAGGNRQRRADVEARRGVPARRGRGRTRLTLSPGQRPSVPATGPVDLTPSRAAGPTPPPPRISHAEASHDYARGPRGARARPRSREPVSPAGR